MWGGCSDPLRMRVDFIHISMGCLITIKTFESRCLRGRNAPFVASSWTTVSRQLLANRIDAASMRGVSWRRMLPSGARVRFMVSFLSNVVDLPRTSIRPLRERRSARLLGSRRGTSGSSAGGSLLRTAKSSRSLHFRMCKGEVRETIRENNIARFQKK